MMGKGDSIGNYRAICACGVEEEEAAARERNGVKASLSEIVRLLATSCPRCGAAEVHLRIVRIVTHKCITFCQDGLENQKSATLSSHGDSQAFTDRQWQLPLVRAKSVIQWMGESNE